MTAAPLQRVFSRLFTSHNPLCTCNSLIKWELVREIYIYCMSYMSTTPLLSPHLSVRPTIALTSLITKRIFVQGSIICTLYIHPLRCTSMQSSIFKGQSNDISELLFFSSNTSRAGQLVQIDVLSFWKWRWIRRDTYSPLRFSE